MTGTDFEYRQGSGEFLSIDEINTSDTEKHQVVCPLRFKSVLIEPINYDIYLYAEQGDTKYKTIRKNTSLTIDLTKLGGYTAFYLKSSTTSTNRIEILFLA
jgi:hypothetical protein